MKKYLIFWVVMYISLVLRGGDGSHFTNNIHRYTWANYQAFCGNTDAAKQWYHSIFSSFGSVYSYKGYIHLLFQHNQYAHITQLMTKLSTQFATDPDLQRIFAISLQHSGKIPESDALFISLATQFPYDHEIAFHAVNSYLRIKEPNNALTVINTILNRADQKSYEFIFYFLKAQTHLQMSNRTGAKEAVQQCLEINPHFDKAWLLLALLLEQEGNVREAIKGFTSYLHLVKTPQKDIEQHVLDLILRQKKSTDHHSSLLLPIHSFDIGAHYINGLKQLYCFNLYKYSF